MLPRKYLSYSAWILWNQNKQAFRDQYYSGEFKKFSSPETDFGSKIADMIEAGDPSVDFIPRYSFPEFKLEVPFEETLLHGRIDSFCPETFSFMDHKTGRVKWTDKKVSKLKQLVFYSLLCQMLFGKVNDTAKLVWIETELNDEPLMYKGRILSRKKEVRMTGNLEVFERVITQEERDKMKEQLIKDIRDIKEDYIKWITSVDIVYKLHTI